MPRSARTTNPTHRKSPPAHIPETSYKEDDEIQPPTPREVEFFNETLNPKPRAIPRKPRRVTAKSLYRHNLSRERRPRQTDAATQTMRNASTQTSPVDSGLPPRAASNQHSKNNKPHFNHSSKGLEDISFAELQQILMMIRRRSTSHDQHRVSAPNVKMFTSSMQPTTGGSPSGENTGESLGGRRTPLSPSRVNFPKKSHEVVPRLRFEKLRSPRAQFGTSGPLSSERSSGDRAHHTYHVIPSPRSAFSDVGSDGASSQRSSTPR